MFSFVRLCRTASSECYVVFPVEESQKSNPRVGTIDLHFVGLVTHGTLVLESELDEELFEALIAQIDAQFIPSDREDFIFTAYFGKEIGFYSDTVTDEDRSHQGVTRKDLQEIRTSLSKVLGRHQIARGKLTEHAVAAYFESLGYDAQRAGAELDALKVDVVARNDKEIVFVQSKLGKLSNSEMRKIVTAIASLPVEEGKMTVVGLVAREFPKDSERHRRTLEAEFDLQIMCVQLYQIAAAVPEYRHALGI